MIACCAGLPEQTVDAGVRIIEEGRKPGILYVLVEGAVEVLRGDVVVHTTTQPGAFFGEMSMLLGTPYTASVRTLERSRFYLVDDPPALLRSHPELGLSLARLLAHRLRLVTGYLVDLQHQFADRDDHFGLVEQVLATLVHHQPDDD
ncbi:MAG TPA: cyclic nucleotide-binding domain-containing protein [Candidatus Binatia bacterium]|nr:cyclic nucleotide-binding domain-containing protein [Candidatus Binatia bacterium]